MAPNAAAATSKRRQYMRAMLSGEDVQPDPVVSSSTGHLAFAAKASVSKASAMDERAKSPASADFPAGARLGEPASDGWRTRRDATAPDIPATGSLPSLTASPDRGLPERGLDLSSTVAYPDMPGMATDAGSDATSTLEASLSDSDLPDQDEAHNANLMRELFGDDTADGSLADGIPEEDDPGSERDGGIRIPMDYGDPGLDDPFDLAGDFDEDDPNSDWEGVQEAQGDETRSDLPSVHIPGTELPGTEWDDAGTEWDDEVDLLAAGGGQTPSQDQTAFHHLPNHHLPNGQNHEATDEPTDEEIDALFGADREQYAEEEALDGNLLPAQAPSSASERLAVLANRIDFDRIHSDEKPLDGRHAPPLPSLLEMSPQTARRAPSRDPFGGQQTVPSQSTNSLPTNSLPADPLPVDPLQAENQESVRPRVSEDPERSRGRARPNLPEPSTTPDSASAASTNAGNTNPGTNPGGWKEAVASSLLSRLDAAQALPLLLTLEQLGQIGLPMRARPRDTVNRVLVPWVATDPLPGWKIAWTGKELRIEAGKGTGPEEEEDYSPNGQALPGSGSVATAQTATRRAVGGTAIGARTAADRTAADPAQSDASHDREAPSSEVRDTSPAEPSLSGTSSPNIPHPSTAGPSTPGPSTPSPSTPSQAFPETSPSALSSGAHAAHGSGQSGGFVAGQPLRTLDMVPLESRRTAADGAVAPKGEPGPAPADLGPADLTDPELRELDLRELDLRVPDLLLSGQETSDTNVDPLREALRQELRLGLEDLFLRLSGQLATGAAPAAADDRNDVSSLLADRITDIAIRLDRMQGLLERAKTHPTPVAATLADPDRDDDRDDLLEADPAFLTPREDEWRSTLKRDRMLAPLLVCTAGLVLMIAMPLVAWATTAVMAPIAVAVTYLIGRRDPGGQFTVGAAIACSAALLYAAEHARALQLESTIRELARALGGTVP